MAAPEGTITVKLHLDATEFWAELARVQEAILELGDGHHAEKAELVDTLRAGGSIAPRITHQVGPRTL